MENTTQARTIPPKAKITIEKEQPLLPLLLQQPTLLFLLHQQQ